MAKLQEERSYNPSIHVMNLLKKCSRGIQSYHDKMVRHLFEISCLDGLENMASLKRLPSEFLSHYRKALDLYDASNQFLLGQLRRCGLQVSCRFGCSHCCYHMPTGVSVTELVCLYHAMHQGGLLDRFFRRSLEAEEKLGCIYQWCRESNAAEKESDRESMLKSYNRCEQLCPFLQEDTCQVYPYRPLACRMHFSLSPAHWCHPSHFQNPYAIQINLEPLEGVWEAFDRVDSRFKLGLSDVMVCGLLELTVNVMKFDEIRFV
jgi:Fe-S-cluster containining protein